MVGDGGIMNRENSEGLAPGGTGHANREKPLGPNVHEILEAQIVSGGHLKTKEKSHCYGKTEPLKASGDEGDGLSDEDLDNAPIEQMGMVINWLQRERARSRGSGGQNSRSKGPRVPRCNNCKKHHSGKCHDPPRCYHCTEVGHTRVSCCNTPKFPTQK
ncbi:unnamed protein product [Cuscuta epithymum]|uniref:CCHC-type domain-containing protein n=1 Tax=Cuscuta epithymum TaxID=186058 RepID=A0AAV0EEI1_9ASTE|nr:unnamed protein product [Cuscuta epithymum]